MFRRNVIANYLGQGWIALMSLAFVPLYIKYLGIEAYGLIGLFAVLQGWLSLFDMGMAPMLGREMARFTAGKHTPQSIRDLLRSLELVVYSLAFLMASGIWGASNWLSNTWLHLENLQTPEVAHAISVMALVVGLKFCEGIYRSAIVGLLEQVWLSSVNALLQTIRQLGAVAILAFVAPTIDAFFIWQALISALTLVIFFIKLHLDLPKSPMPAKFSIAGITDVWRFAGGMFGINILVLLLTQVDKLLLSTLLTLQNYAYYMLAGAIAGIVPMVIAPVTQAIYPLLVELHAVRNEMELTRLFHKGAQLVTLTTAPLMLVVAIFPELIIYVWSGDLELAKHVAPILMPMIIGSFLNGLMWMPYQTQLAYGWTSLTIRVNSIAVLILVPAIFFLVPIYGWVILNIGYLLIATNFMFKKILKNQKWRWWIKDILFPILCLIPIVFLIKYTAPIQIYEDRIQSFIYLLAIGLLGMGIIYTSNKLPLINKNTST